MIKTKLVLFSDLSDTEIRSLPIAGFDIIRAAHTAEKFDLRIPEILAKNPVGALFVFRDAQLCLDAVIQWRTSEETYLLPAIVAVDEKAGEMHPVLKLLADHYTDILKFPGTNIELLTSDINARNNEHAISSEFSGVPRVRFLLYLAMRNITEIDPIKHLGSSFGYTWPLAQHLLGEPSIGDEVHALDDIVREGLLEAETVEAIHACPICENARISTAKACSNCGGSVIKQTNIVHHYSCGGVFPEQEGWTDEGLRCVKCHRKLVHIGVDYERPVSVDYCTHCGHSQEIFDYQGHCFECAHTFPLKDGKTILVKKYRPVRSADELIQHFQATSPQSSMERRYLEPPNFSQILESQKKHLRRRTDTFSLLTFDLDEDSDFSQSTSIVEHLVVALRDSDLVTRSAQNKIRAMLRITPLEEAQKCVGRLRDQIGRNFIKRVRVEEFSNHADEHKTVAISWKD